MYHKPNEDDNACVRKVQDYEIEQGCAAHTHSCDCATEYQITPMPPYGFRVVVWQWLGDKADDSVFHQRGILRNLYEEARLGLFL